MGRNKRSEFDRHLSPDNFKKLLDEATVNLRDYTLIYTAGNLGLRVGEVVRIKVQDIMDDRVIVPCLKREKGRIKRNQLPKSYESKIVSESVIKTLNEYRDEYNPKEWLFEGRGGHLTERAAQSVFCKYRDRVGLNPAFSFHTLRHARGSAVYEATGDIKAVQIELRHRDIKSSSLYATMSEKMKRKIVDDVGVVE